MVKEQRVSVFRLDGINDGTSDLYKTGVLTLNTISHKWRDEIYNQIKSITSQINFEKLLVINLNDIYYPDKVYDVKENGIKYLMSRILMGNIYNCFILLKDQELFNDLEKMVIELKEYNISVELVLVK